MGLVPDKEQGVVTTSREEFRDMPRGWAVGEVLVPGSFDLFGATAQLGKALQVLQALGCHLELKPGDEDR
jgi:hypothetical protein